MFAFLTRVSLIRTDCTMFALASEMLTSASATRPPSHGRRQVADSGLAIIRLPLSAPHPVPSTQLRSSDHLIAHPERGRQTCAEEINPQHPSNAMLPNCLALW